MEARGVEALGEGQVVAEEGGSCKGEEGQRASFVSDPE